MSETVEIIVHGKFHQRDSISNRKLTVEKGENLLRALKKNGCYLRDCSGNGTCGKCRVRFLSPAPLPTSNERVLLSAEELRGGYRLACRHCVRSAAEIELHIEPARLPDVIMDEPKDAFDQCDERYYVIVDIGTTTVAMQAVQGEKKLGSYAAMNPQRSFGADVASRISAGMQGHLREMSDQIRACIMEGVSSLTGQCGRRPDYMVISGNTTMNYILRRLPVEVLGSYPFSPTDTRGAELELGGIKAYLVPGLSAFVGGDITAGILAQEMQTSERDQLLLDLGTNGEMVLGRKGKLLCTATAAGPAFEGGISSQMMGADLIRITAQLLKEGILDETGLFGEPYFSEGIYREGVRITNQDIRELQKAKAAVSAGIGILLKQYGISETQVETIYLAGGFGYYLDPESAIRIGLLPEGFRGKIKAVGNSALAGAGMIGRKLEEGSSFYELFQEVQDNSTVINLAEEAEFQQRFLAHLNF